MGSYSMVRLECMPDVTNDERGRRIFQLHKERAVEAALEKIRLNPKSDWATFSQQDIKSLSTMLGETWSQSRGVPGNSVPFPALPERT